MVFEEAAGAQTPFVIVQASVFMPRLKLVIAVVGEAAEAITALPVAIDHTPVPDEGALPMSNVVGVLIHKVWLSPATG